MRPLVPDIAHRTMSGQYVHIPVKAHQFVHHTDYQPVIVPSRLIGPAYAPGEKRIPADQHPVLPVIEADAARGMPRRGYDLERSIPEAKHLPVGKVCGGKTPIRDPHPESLRQHCIVTQHLPVVRMHQHLNPEARGHILHPVDVVEMPVGQPYGLYLHALGRDFGKKGGAFLVIIERRVHQHALAGIIPKEQGMLPERIEREVLDMQHIDL